MGVLLYSTAVAITQPRDIARTDVNRSTAEHDAVFTFIGTVQPDFRPVVFSSIELIWETDHAMENISSILVKISHSFSKF